eukprot:m.33319 g.33319  ORF g.33319 m.33319 type:complete len:409 (-) comp14226_c0_seq1:534-1760(-)
MSFSSLQLLLIASFLVAHSSGKCINKKFDEVEFIEKGNRYAITTMSFGAISIAGCLCVVLVILAFKKDQQYLRERIILGLMFANISYSAANTTPLFFANTQTCTYHLSQVDSMWARGAWVFGKYCMVCYEIFIMSTSVYTLRTGTKVPLRAEVGAHVSCGLVGLIAFTMWVVLQKPVSTRFDDFHQQLLTAIKDQNHSKQALLHSEMDSQIEHAQRNLGGMLRVWLLPLFVSMLLWITSRYLYHRLCVQWHLDYVQALKRWNRDHWGQGDQCVVTVQSKLLHLRKEAYDEITKPLEPYIVVFAIFAIPAAVMSTDKCIHESMPPGYCTVPCETILAARSFATACVYFWKSEHREELFQLRRLFFKLRMRIQAVCCMHASFRNSNAVEFSQVVSVRLLDGSDDNEDSET